MSAVVKELDAPRPHDDPYNVEVIKGIKLMSPRPRLRHGVAASRLGVLLGRFDQIVGPPGGGPGGWWLIDEPELHLPGADPIIPDLGGWRVDRVPKLPDAAFCEIVPDWVCEVLSTSTASSDRALKLPFYEEQRVGHLWLLDPRDRTLEVYRLEGEGYRRPVTFTGEQVVRADPFGDLELGLPLLWPIEV